MYTISYNFSQSIIKISLSGNITLTEVETMAQELFSNIKDLQVYLLTDTRNAQYDFSISDFSELFEIVSKYSNPSAKVYEAILIDSPKEVAISTYLDTKIQRNNHIQKIFTTEKAALEWLAFFEKK